MPQFRPYWWINLLSWTFAIILSLTFSYSPLFCDHGSLTMLVSTGSKFIGISLYNSSSVLYTQLFYEAVGFNFMNYSALLANILNG